MGIGSSHVLTSIHIGSTLQILAETCSEYLLFDTLQNLALLGRRSLPDANICIPVSLGSSPGGSLCQQSWMFRVVQSFKMGDSSNHRIFSTKWGSETKTGPVVGLQFAFPCLKIGFASHIFWPNLPLCSTAVLSRHHEKTSSVPQFEQNLVLFQLLHGQRAF